MLMNLSKSRITFKFQGMTNSSSQSEERESEEVVVITLVDDTDTDNTVIHQGIPLIPIDLFIKKNRKCVRFFDAFDNLIYISAATSVDPLPLYNRSLRGRVLLDSSSDPVVSIFRSHDGSWKGFKGDGCGKLVFEADQTLNTFSKIEFNVLLTQEDGSNITFVMRGCLFWRTCTIYQDKFIVAQTNLMYKLGFMKHFVGRSKFRVTIFPGFSDYNFIASLILVFLDSRKR